MSGARDTDLDWDSVQRFVHLVANRRPDVDHHVAADVAQETLLALWSLDRAGALRPSWRQLARTVCTRLASRTRIRERRCAAVSADELEQLHATAVADATTASGADLSRGEQVLRFASEILSARQTRVLRLWYRSTSSRSAQARALGMSLTEHRDILRGIVKKLQKYPPPRKGDDVIRFGSPRRSGRNT